MGAPIYYLDKDGDPYIVGIHTEGWSDIFSKGVSIASTAFNVINQVVGALNKKEFALEGERPSEEAMGLPLHRIVEPPKIDYIEKPQEDLNELSMITEYAYPYTSVGCLMAKWKNGRAVQGTAFIVSKHAILTAYSNVYSDENEPASDIAFFAGCFDKKGVGFPVVKTVTVPSSSNKNAAAYRLALLFVEDNIQQSFGSLSLYDKDSSSESFERRAFTMSGYPNLKGEKNFQYTDSGLLSIAGHGQIFHEMSTGPGSGGSPIFFKSVKDQQYYAVAVHLGIQSGVKIASKITN